MSAIDQLAKPTSSPREASRHRTIAWVVMLLGFAVFCLIVYGLVQFGYSVYANATSAVTATVVRDTGTDLTIKKVISAQYTAPAPDPSGAVKSEIGDGDTIRTGVDTQARLILPDGSLVQVFPNTQITVNQIQASRFSHEQVNITLTQQPFLNLNSNPGSYIIVGVPSQPNNGYRNSHVVVNTCAELTNLACAALLAHVEVNPASTVRISTASDPNSALRSGPQQYYFYSRATVLQGGATMTNAQDSVPPVGIGLYQMATVGTGGMGLPSIAEAWDEFIVDGTFTDKLEHWGQPIPNQGLDGGNLNGQVAITDTLNTLVNARVHAAEFYRCCGTTDYASIAIGQQLDRDLSPYIPAGKIRLSADVRLLAQTVAGLGDAGVEAPLIFKFTYKTGDSDNEIPWEYRYYFTPGPKPIDPNIGQQIAGDQWVHVEIANLLDLPGLKGMKRIVKLEIYAAGHDYHSVVTNVSLQAR